MSLLPFILLQLLVGKRDDQGEMLDGEDLEEIEKEQMLVRLVAAFVEDVSFHVGFEVPFAPLSIPIDFVKGHARKPWQ